MTKPVTVPPPDLEPRFLPPEGWRWHVFRNARGQRLRFGTVSPKSRIPDAVVVGLPGLSEFSEKYFEVAHDLLDRNLAFWVIDWQGQGYSDRHLKNRQKRHATSFDDDITDLHFFIMEYVKHASVHPDVGRIPMVMLAHSMGGNIGLRYLIKHPDIFACAAFTAPMTGIQATAMLPGALGIAVSGLLRLLLGKSFIFGGGKWSPDDRTIPERNIFSTDPIRAAVHNAWCLADPLLQVGNVTFGWLHEALRSCAALKHDIARHPITIPCLFGLAGQDKLVINNTTRRLAARLPDARIIDLPDAYHEILMEQDSSRSLFLAELMDLLHKNNIKDQLKPF